MCGRYALAEPDEITPRFGVTPKEPLKPNYNAAPGQFMPVITRGEDGKRKLDIMKWGLVPVWSKDEKIGYKLINARAESLFEKNTWRTVIKKRRCLIPATGFYEWKREGTDKKQPYYIHPRDDALFAFAGIWEVWHDHEGGELHTYSIITTEPNAEMTEIHNRMPVILHQEDEDAWLDAPADDQAAIEQFLHPYEDHGLDMFEVSTEVNVVRNNDNKLILPINSK